MRKVISAVALASLLWVPAASAGGSGAAASPDIADLERKIEELSRQLDALKAAMEQQKEVNVATSEQVSDLSDEIDDMDERSEAWDLASRFNFFGDFRARYDYYNADTVFNRTLSNDALFTNRLRLSMDVKATEQVEFKGRLAMYKAWGMQSAFNDASGTMWPVFDGNITRTPVSDSALYVDRAYVNWNGIGGAPIWLSIGRRPTTDGPPGQFRLGWDEERFATPVAFFDYPFDGFVLGYGYSWGNDDLGTGKFRFCFGRGFEAGLQQKNTGLDDTDFAGFNWDILNKDVRLLNLQSFIAFNVFNYPNFQDPIINEAFGEMSGFGERQQLGNIWHTDMVYQDKISSLNYFISAGWSQTQPNSNGIFNDFAAMAAGMTGPNESNENGYAVYAGIRYDLDESNLKFGAEWNYGSQYWISFTPGHDDIYMAKLATRGNVFELYTIWDIPAGEAISKYGRAFIRLGWQHYSYDYAGSGDWNMYPYDLGNGSDLQMLQMMGMDPVESADQIYVTFEAFF
jgi:hypothetical protein